MILRHTSPAILALVFISTACSDDDTATTEVSVTSNVTTDPTGAPDVTATATDTPTTGTAPGTTTSEAGTTAEPSTTAPGVTSREPNTGEPSSTSGEPGSSSTTGDPVCKKGEIQCSGAVAQVCDGQGGFASEESCPIACVPNFGCVDCISDEGCDDLQGLTCENGACVGSCAPATLGTSYVGCDYYALNTPGGGGAPFTFALVVSNVSDEDADVTITREDVEILDLVVPKQSVEIIPLPWVSELTWAPSSKLVPEGAYRVRSTRPLTLYQYSPLENTKNGTFSYSGDASLLMPTNVWSTETYVVTRNVHWGNAGFYAVVASEDGTVVTVHPSATGKIVSEGAGIAADGSGMAMLNEGDVLLVRAAPGGGDPDISDLTGTRVLSDRPVMVMGAHDCTFVPHDVSACDHIEELNLPLDTLAKEYFVSTPWVKPPNKPPMKKARMVRIVATSPGTTLTYDPPQNGAPTLLMKAGDYLELQTDQDFRITASAKIAVAEYLLGWQATGNNGDPAMTIAVPTEQYRTNYSFHAPTNFENNFVNIIAPTNAAITLDGQPVVGLTPIGATGFSVARVELSNAGDGNHALAGNQAFGVQVYGHGSGISYSYPGGLNLKVIPN